MYACPTDNFNLVDSSFDCNNQGVNSTFIEPKRQNYQGDSFRNISYQDRIGGQYLNEFVNSFQIPMEEREDTQFTSIDRNLGYNEAPAITQRFTDQAKVTHRQTRNSRRNGNLSQPDREKGAYSFQHGFVYARPTHKETVQTVNYQGISGPATEQVQSSRDQYNRATSQGLKEASLTSYFPNAHKQINPQSTKNVNIQIRNQLSNEEYDHPLFGGTPYQTIQDTSNCGMATSITKGQRIPEENTQLDLSVGVTQLRNNPFSLRPFHTL